MELKRVGGSFSYSQNQVPERLEPLSPDTSTVDAVSIDDGPHKSLGTRLKHAAVYGVLAASSAIGAAAAAPMAGAATPIVTLQNAPQKQYGVITPTQVHSMDAFTLSHEARQALLTSVPKPNSLEGQKLLAMMNQVYVWHPSVAPAPAENPNRLKVVNWNIDNPDDAVRITAVLQGHVEALGSKADAQAAEELRQVTNADLYNIQEISAPVAQQLAEKLNLHVVWTPEWINLGEAGQNTAPGHGFTGNAILSRYELKDPEVIRFHNQADWYKDEKAKVPKVELGIRTVGRKGFGVDIPDHEIRVPVPFGGRNALAVDAVLPNGLPTLSDVDVHLENHAKPQVRRKQMAEVEQFVLAEHNPTFFGGDLNTIGNDGRVQTTGRFIEGQVDTPGKVIDKAATIGFHFVPYVGWGKDGYEAYKYVKAHNDPTSVTNAEHLLFKDVRDKLGVKPTDERAKLGYKHTWAMPHQHVLGNSILDWTWFYHPNNPNMEVTESHTFQHMVQNTVANGEERISDHNVLVNYLALR